MTSYRQCPVCGKVIKRKHIIESVNPSREYFEWACDGCSYNEKINIPE